MMNVTSTHLYVPERADVMRDGRYQQADGKEGDEEAYRGEEEPAVGTIGDLLVDEQAEPGEVKQQQNNDSSEAGEEEKYPGSGNVHACIIADGRG